MKERPSPVDDSGEPAPYFTVIIPMYNRAHTIRRCLDSCLRQDFEDYEIIVVDDASDQDDSVAVVESYTDPRVRLVQRAENRGVCAARRLGVEHARGAWLIFIDSDDSLQDGAFVTIHRYAREAPDEVGEIRFCCWCEALQKVTPLPPLPPGVIGFPEYLRWLDLVVNSDLLACRRRSIFERVNWPMDRRFEMQFHLDVAANFKILVTDAVVDTMHDDAGNRLTSSHKKSFDPKGLQVAHDNALACQEILDAYSPALAKYCPRRYHQLMRMVGDFHLRAGERAAGAAAMLRCLARRPFDMVGWGLLAFGLVGPRFLHWAIRLAKGQR